MIVDVNSRIEIGRPAAEVAAHAMEPDNAPLWYQNIKSIEWRTPRPLVVGTELDFVAQFLGRRLAMASRGASLRSSRRSWWVP